MFGASSELGRSWFEAEIWPMIQLASSELARASVMEFGFYTLCISSLRQISPIRGLTRPDQQLHGEAVVVAFKDEK